MKSAKKALTNIRRTPYQALAAILVLTITFFIGTAIALAAIGLNQTLNFFQTAPQVIIFFSSTTPESQIIALQQELTEKPQVVKVDYVSQNQALDIYQQLNQNDPLLLELVTAEILPASLEISTTSIDSLKSIAQEVGSQPGVDEVVLRQDVVEVLDKWLTGLKIAGIGMVSVMATTSILIVGIVVGMKIAGKSYEIKILRLLGADPWYIQGPFLFEGALYGLISSLLAFAFAITLLLYLSPLIVDFAGEVPLLPNDPTALAVVFSLSTISGVLIGTLGSFLAVKHFLRS